jgi:hypothetical protein
LTPPSQQVKQTLADHQGADIIPHFWDEEIAMSAILELSATEGSLVAGGTDYAASAMAELNLTNTTVLPMLGTSTHEPGAPGPTPPPR